jgi:hypothetical protein
MNIFKTIYENIYSASFYSTLSERPFSYSFLYFFNVAIMVCLILSVSYSLVFIPTTNQFIRGVVTTLERNYPPNLVVTVAQGRASVGAGTEIPVVIPASSELAQFFSSARLSVVPSQFLVVDPNLSFSPEAFSKLNTFALLTADVFVFGSPDALVIQPLIDFPSTVFDADQVAHYRSRLMTISSFLSPLFLFGFFIFFLLLFVLYGFWIVPLSFLFFVFVRFFLKRTFFTLGYCYRIFGFKTSGFAKKLYYPS